MAALPPASRRLCLVVDVERYSRFRNPQAYEAQRRVLWSMWHACRAAGVNPRACDQQDRGDGLLLLLPPAVDETVAVPRLLPATHAALSRVNDSPGEVGRLRLRAALTQGPVHRAATGYVGDVVIDACRLLDSPLLRRALAEHGDTDVAALVSEDIYRQVIAHGYGGLDPGAFRRVRVEVPEKKYVALPYLYLPRGPADRKLAPRFTGVRTPYTARGGPAIWSALGVTAAGELSAVVGEHLLDDLVPDDDRPDDEAGALDDLPGEDDEDWA